MQQLRCSKNQKSKYTNREVYIEKFRAKASKASLAQSLIKKLDNVRLDRIEVDEDDTSVMKFAFPPFP